MTGRAPNPDTLVASARAYVNALNKLDDQAQIHRRPGRGLIFLCPGPRAAPNSGLPELGVQLVRGTRFRVSPVAHLSLKTACGLISISILRYRF